MDETTVGSLVLDAYKAQHTEYVDLWKTLDTKAQGTIAIAGIFLAGAFGFARDVGDLEWVPRFLFAGAVVALWASVACAVRALWVSRVRFPPAGETAELELKRLEHLAKEDRASELKVVLYDLASGFRLAITSIEAGIARKATWLLRAQVSIGLGATILTVATLYRVLCR